MYQFVFTMAGDLLFGTCLYCASNFSECSTIAAFSAFADLVALVAITTEEF